MSDNTSQGPATSTQMTGTTPSPAPQVSAPPVPGPTRPRLWPAVALIVFLWLARLLPVYLTPDNAFLMMIGAMWGPMLVTLGLAIWWLFFSRVPWSQRFLGLVLAVGIGIGVWFAAHETMDPAVLIVFALPLVVTAWIVWLLVTPFLQWQPRFAGLLLVVLLSWAFWDSLRFQGVTGTFTPDFWWRWTLTTEERMMAQGGAVANEATSAGLTAAPGDWLGFRGANRDGILTGVTIDTDWKNHPPKPVWRREVGPGWSSFAVVGHHLFSQEQLGPDELVICYDTETGEKIWTHKDTARFTEGLAGPGPRATPTFHAGKLYTQGATGRLNCLDAATGKLLWTRNITEDSGAKIPNWGFASSPLVTKGLVLTYGGAEDKGLLAYDADKGGEPRWMKGKGGHSYCSPQLTRVSKVDQVVLATEKGLVGHDPATGGVFWTYEWALPGMPRVAQPALVGGTDLLLGTFFGYGTRRVNVTHPNRESWKTQEVWLTKAIQPYFNDLVVHKGHLYGFDGNFFTCINLEEGQRKWRVRAGYDNGQALLLADQDLLLVVTESGEVALVEANPEKHVELAKFQALNGKTWNHPVIAHGKLFVRNASEMACYELAPAK
jgi:outer membrane protein assembly factor BamB